RRIVGRRILVPARGAGGGTVIELDAIPPAGPITATVVPCPPWITARPEEVRQFEREAIDPKELGPREICDWRALAAALDGREGRWAGCASHVLQRGAQEIVHDLLDHHARPRGGLLEPLELVRAHGDRELAGGLPGALRPGDHDQRRGLSVRGRRAVLGGLRMADRFADLRLLPGRRRARRRLLALRGLR